MKISTALMFLIFIALGGVIFSGYLSYVNLWGEGCSTAAISCGIKPVSFFGLPTCVYGFCMFLIITVLAVIGVCSKSPEKIRTAILILSIAGVVFAGSVAYYETFVQEGGTSKLPACAYGFFIFIVLLLFSLFGKKRNANFLPIQ